MKIDIDVTLRKPVSIAFGYDKPARKSKYGIEVHVPVLGIYLYLMSRMPMASPFYFVLK